MKKRSQRIGKNGRRSCCTWCERIEPRQQLKQRQQFEEFFAKKNLVAQFLSAKNFLPKVKTFAAGFLSQRVSVEIFCRRFFVKEFAAKICCQKNCKNRLSEFFFSFFVESFSVEVFCRSFCKENLGKIFAKSSRQEFRFFFSPRLFVTKRAGPRFPARLR